MYWIDSSTRKIMRSNLDGSHVVTLLSDGLQEPSEPSHLQSGTSNKGPFEKGITSQQRMHPFSLVVHSSFLTSEERTTSH